MDKEGIFTIVYSLVILILFFITIEVLDLEVNHYSYWIGIIILATIQVIGLMIGYKRIAQKTTTKK